MERSTPIETAEAIVARERLRLLALAHYTYGGHGLVDAAVLRDGVDVITIRRSSGISRRRLLRCSTTAACIHGRLLLLSRSRNRRRRSSSLFCCRDRDSLPRDPDVSALPAYAGWCIHQRKKRTLIYIVSGFNCLFVPYGTLLGVCTIVVLGSPEAQAEFPTADG